MQLYPQHGEKEAIKQVQEGSGRQAPSCLPGRGRLWARPWEARPRRGERPAALPHPTPGCQGCQEALVTRACRLHGGCEPVGVVQLIDPRSPCHCQGTPQRAQQCPDCDLSPHQMASPPVSAASRQAQTPLTMRARDPPVTSRTEPSQDRGCGEPWRSPSGLPFSSWGVATPECLHRWGSPGAAGSGPSLQCHPHAAPSCSSPTAYCLLWLGTLMCHVLGMEPGEWLASPAGQDECTQLSSREERDPERQTVTVVMQSEP